jgi:2-(1,2-epoxy-1,2-dihydrophenyl)acetyl-CoA isomerase
MTGQAVRRSSVALSVDGQVARLTLSCPERGNALDAQLVGGLAEAVEQLGKVSFRALLLRSEGAHFTLGGDLAHLHSQLERLDQELQEIVPVYHNVLRRLAVLDVPVVCAAQGVAGGGGLGLVWAADVVIAASDLRLVTGFAGLGLSGDGGSSWVLPRLVGDHRARRMMLLGEPVDAQQALDWGLVDRVVEPSRLDQEAEAQASQLAQGPTVAYGHIKRLLRVSPSHGFVEQLGAEQAAIVACGGTADGREGITAFAQRRRPRFVGS